MVHATHLSAAELHAAIGTTEMPPLGETGVAPPPEAVPGVAPPVMTSMAPQMMMQPPHAMVSNGHAGPGGMFLPPSSTSGNVPPNVCQVSPPHFAPNASPHPVPAGGVSLQHIAAMYHANQQFPPQNCFQQQYHQATAFPSAHLSPQVRMQIQHRQQAASQRFLSSNATQVFAQAETMHLMAIKRVQIDKMKKEMVDGNQGGIGAVGTCSTLPKNVELEAAASMAAVEALSSAMEEPKK